MEYRNTEPNGCDKGETCENFHPILCEESLKTGGCFDETCTLVHVKQRKGEIKNTTDDNLEEFER